MDTIFHNGNLVTLDPAHPHAQAAAVKNGVILRLGSDTEILPLATPETALVDLGGRLTLPGFCDSHLHLLSFGYSLEKINLDSCASREELVSAARTFAEAHPHLKWIQGRGWNNERWQSTAFPTRHDLDRACPDRPMTLTRTCGHIIVANSRALEVMAVTGDTPQVPGGHIDMDASGQPLGIFRESARDFIYNAIPPLTELDIRRMVTNGGREAQKYGITSVQSDDFEAVTPAEDTALLAAFRGLAAEGALPVRVYQQCLVPPVGRLERFMARGNVTGAGDSFFKIGPLKLLCDGTLGARTAAMSKPYADDATTRGIAVYTQDELDALVAAAHKVGMTVALHTIGDRCIDMGLDAIERAQMANPRPDMRHSLIHCQITRPDQLKRLKDLGVGVHFQPIFIDGDMHIAEKRVGGARVKSCYNWRTLVDSGVPYACGSDCPVEPFDVMKGIYCAVTGMDLSGQPAGGWMPEQRLTVAQAVHGYTLGAARMAYEEGIKGSLAPGKLADMAVLEENIFTMVPEKIKDVKVGMTILNGNVVYRREG